MISVLLLCWETGWGYELNGLFKVPMIRDLAEEAEIMQIDGSAFDDLQVLLVCWETGWGYI